MFSVVIRESLGRVSRQYMWGVEKLGNWRSICVVWKREGEEGVVFWSGREGIRVSCAPLNFGINENKCGFTQHTMQVHIGCSWRGPGTLQLMVPEPIAPMYHCKSGSNIIVEVEGPCRAPSLLKKPFKSPLKFWDYWKQVWFQAAHNLGSRQLFLTVSWDIATNGTWADSAHVSL